MLMVLKRTPLMRGHNQLTWKLRFISQPKHVVGKRPFNVTS